jgi:hypothetical protein
MIFSSCRERPRLRVVHHCTVLAAFVVGMAACSSDAKSTATTAADTAAAGAATSDAVPTDATLSGDPDDARQTVAAFTIAQGAQFGYTLDEDCVAGVVAKLSDADVTLLAESTLDTAPGATSPPLSDEGEQLGTMVLDCAKTNTNTDLVEQASQTILGSANGGSLDPDCVRKSFSRLTDEQLQLVIDSGPESTDERLQPVGISLLDCLDTSSDTVTDTTA